MRGEREDARSAGGRAKEIECHEGWRDRGVARSDMYPDREWSEECRILIT